MVPLKQATGSLGDKPLGNGGGHGKLAGVVGWIKRRITGKRDQTPDERADLRDGPGCQGSPHLGLALPARARSDTQKDLRAVEQRRPDVAAARQVWINYRQPFMRNMLTRLAFTDQTWLKTNMAKTTG